MSTTFFDKFKLNYEKEELQSVLTNINNGIVFRGTNLWILIFAIFVASLGLNVNSTAVIIGAMLISPLLGPIMGLGFGIAIHDIALLRKALLNYGFAAVIGLATSTAYFLFSPINEAHSEILARTSPNIYDVLIAFFGGLAGTIATSSKHKGNVIPGVAIATALMPPLCTAGYGLATLQINFFFGAFYLFLINTVFIALAAFITVRLLKFPIKHLLDKKAERKAQRIIWIIVILTLLPSLYFGYDLVEQIKFTTNANEFISKEAIFPNDYLLNKKIDPKSKTIRLTFGGNLITGAEINLLKSKLPNYDLNNVELEIRQGFAYLNNDNEDEQKNTIAKVLETKEIELRNLQNVIDSSVAQKKTGRQIFTELKIQYPEIIDAVIQPSTVMMDSLKTQPTFIVILKMKKSLQNKEKIKLESWLKTRLQLENIELIIEE